MRRLIAIAGLLFICSPVLSAPSEDNPLESIVRAPLDVTAATVGMLTDVFDLGFIRVKGGRLESAGAEGRFDSPRSGSLLSAVDLERSVPDSLPEILSRDQGVTYTDDMGHGLGARVDLRGFGGEAKQALVLMDGLRAVEPFDNSVTWHLYPAEYFETVTVLPGGASPVYGEGALSGVISMRSKEPTSEWHVETESALGSYDLERHFVAVSGTTDPGVGVWFGARHMDTEGYRQNSSHESASTMLNNTYEWTEFLKLENSFYFADNETGIPGPLLPEEAVVNRRQKDPDGQFGDKFNDRLVQDGLLLDYYAEPIGVQVTNLAGYRRREQNSIQSFGGAFPGTSLNGIETESFSDVVQATRVWGEKERRYTLFTGVEWSIDDVYNPFRFEDATFGPFESERSIDRRLWGVFFQNRLELWEKWILEGGVRFDRIDWDIYDLKAPSLEKHKKAENTSPQIALSYSPNETATLFAGYSQAFKVPDSNTLIFETPNIFTPSPDIDPSIAHHYEVGERVKLFEGFSGKAAAFYIETKKEILFNDIANTNQNFDTRRYGAEVSFDWRIHPAWRTSFASTFTDARFDNGPFDEKHIPLVPETRWFADLEWTPDADWTVLLEATCEHRRYALNDFNNRFYAGDYIVAGLEVRRRLPKGEWFFKANNLFDKEYSQFVTSDGVNVVNVNPSPEFNLEAGVRFEI